MFRNAEVTPDVMLASACLPTMFQAVEIDGEPYWDGGYSGNPTLTPLVRECDASDTIIVPINPVERPGTPRSARDILNRLNEISFNSAAIKELRMMALLQQAADPGSGEGAVWASMRIHRIRNDVMVGLGYSSKLNAEWDFLTMLRDKGRAAADDFLGEHGQDLGKRSTMDLRASCSRASERFRASYGLRLSSAPNLGQAGVNMAASEKVTCRLDFRCQQWPSACPLRDPPCVAQGVGEQ